MTTGTKRIRWAAALLIAAAALTVSSCGKKKTVEVTPTTAAATVPATTKAAETKPAAEVTTAPGTTEAPKEAEKTGTASAKKLKFTLAKYETGTISVEYPVISGMDDSSQQEKLNEHLKENALAILKNYPDSAEPLDQEKDTLDVKCDVISADANRVVAVYNGYYSMENGAHPNNIFYTNTVETKTLKDISLKNAADPYTLAAYALSEDAETNITDKELLAAFKDWQKDTTVEQYQTCLENADFPLTKGSDGKTVTWPDSFSYESEGQILFSVPVPHAVGDYVIVVYDVVTK